MRKLAIVLAMLAAAPLVAQVRPRPPQTNGTELVVTAQQGFWLFVDGTLQNERPVGSICVQGVERGRHYLRVELDNALRNAVGQYVDTDDSRCYAVVRSDGFYGLTTARPDGARPELTVTVAGLAPGAVEESAPSVAMGAAEFARVRDQLKNESFDNTRLTIAKQVVAANRMTAAQITEICGLFSFESNILDFAKFAYDHCVDPNRYYLVNSAFKLESSKRELNEFVNGK